MVDSVSGSHSARSGEAGAASGTVKEAEVPVSTVPRVTLPTQGRVWCALLHSLRLPSRPLAPTLAILSGQSVRLLSEGPARRQYGSPSHGREKGQLPPRVVWPEESRSWRTPSSRGLTGA